MISKIIVCLFVGVCFSTSIAQQSYFPIFQNGKWFITNKEGEKTNSLPFSYVFPFDFKEITLAKVRDKYVVINSKGELLCAEKFENINLLNEHSFLGRNGKFWSVFSKKEGDFSLLKDSIISFKRYNSNNYIFIERNLIKSIVNLKTNKIYSIDDNINNYLITPNGIIISDTSNQIKFFSQDDEKVSTKKGRLITMYLSSENDRVDNGLFENVNLQEMSYCNFNTSIIDTLSSNDENQIHSCVFFKNKVIELPFQTNSFYEINDTIFCRGKNTFAIIDGKTEQVLKIYPYYDIIEDIDPEKLKLGVINDQWNQFVLLDKRTLKPLSKDTFNYFTQSEKYLFAYKNSFSRIFLTEPFREIFQGNYTNLSELENDLLLTKLNKFSGLYSLKNKQFILPCECEQIEIENTIIRCATKGFLKIIQLNLNNHTIINETRVANPVKIRTVKPSAKVLGFLFDPRLHRAGWYIDSSQTQEIEGESFVNLKVFLQTDSLKMNASKYPGNPYYASENHTFIEPSVHSKTFYESKNLKEFVGKVVCSSSGKMLPQKFYFVDTFCQKNRNYLRTFSNEGFGFLFPNDSLFKVSYIDFSSDSLVPFAQSGTLEITTQNSNDVVSNKYLHFGKRTSQFVKDDNEINERAIVKNAKWNYLQADGTILPGGPYEFAYPFQNGNAIVRKGGKYGVITKNSILIPFEYSFIYRENQADTTFFRLHKNGASTQVYTTNFEAVENRSYKLEKEGLILFQQEREFKLCDSLNNELFSSVKEPRIIENGFYVKEKKEYRLFDKEGSELLQSTLKPIAVIENGGFVFEKSGKQGLFKKDSTLVIPFKFKSIRQFGDYILGENNPTSVFTLEGKECLVLDQKNIFLDEVTKMIYFFQNEKWFRLEGTKKVKINQALTQISQVWNGVFISEKLGKANKNNAIIELGKEEMEVQSFNSEFLIIKSNRKWFVYDEMFTKIDFQDSVRKVFYLEKNLFLLSLSNGKQLFYQLEKQLFSSQFDVSNKIISTGKIGVCVNKKWSFYDLELNEISKESYVEVKPFVGTIAPVRSTEGWTVINSYYENLSLSHFGEIDIYSNNAIQTCGITKKGLASMDGEILIPAEFDVLQVRENAELFYLEKDGSNNYFSLSKNQFLFK